MTPLVCKQCERPKDPEKDFYTYHTGQYRVGTVVQPCKACHSENCKRRHQRGVQRPNAKTIEEYLDRYTRYADGDACWEWTGKLYSNGYGQVCFGGKRYLAHRLVYERKHGVLPQHIKVLHKCDNKKCRREDHLFAGSTKDNAQDAISKGLPYGRPRALTDDQIRTILTRLSQGAVGHHLAEEYDVSDTTIFRIRHHIDGYGKIT